DLAGAPICQPVRTPRRPFWPPPISKSAAGLPSSKLSSGLSDLSPPVLSRCPSESTSLLLEAPDLVSERNSMRFATSIANSRTARGRREIAPLVTCTQGGELVALDPF